MVKCAARSRLSAGFVAALLSLAACASPAGPAATLPPATVTPEPMATAAPGTIRPAAVAGSWYPGSAAELAQVVDQMLLGVRPIDGAPLLLILPHAGYAFSGPIAAAGFRQMLHGEYDVAVIIAADHYDPLSAPISVWAAGGFETPLGVVPIDVELAQALVAADARITADPAPHEGEHVVEVQLPFLQRVCPSCAVVPVLMGAADEETVQALTAALLATLPGRRAVVIASSDLSHYPAQEDAQLVDGATLAAIETGDPAAVQASFEMAMAAGVPNLVTCACSEGPIQVVMRAAPYLGVNTITVLGYATSADSPQGDPSAVVGYGAVMFWHYEPPALTAAMQEELLLVARQSIASYLENGAIPPYEPADPLLTRYSGVFVTLEQEGELRGCIGHTWPDQPLYLAVQQMAAAAATEDPRFSPLALEELGDVTLEVSVLSPFFRLTDLERIQVGVHGLMILAAGQQGLILPQVAVEEGWDRDAYLEALCQKAGLGPGCWQEGAAIYAFTAQVFGE